MRRKAGSGAVAWLCVACALLVPRVSAATTGNDTRLEVLGYAAGDQRIYVLLHYDTGGELPVLSYFDLGHNDPQPVVAKSWYEGASDRELEDAFDDRLAKLRRRLQPLELVEAGEVELAVEVVRRRKVMVDTGLEDEAFNAYDLRATVTWSGTSAETEIVAYHRREVRLKGTWRVPGADVAVAVVGFTGVLEEGGYERQALLLLRPAPPEP